MQVQRFLFACSRRIHSSVRAAMALRFDGRVALITGAGGGLGKEYALLLASRGAKVVVNDLGGSEHGEGKSSRAADKVVEIIRSNGGTAVANYDSVVEGDKVVKTAIDNFGRIDILINNAGILRDRSFLKMTEKDWDLVHAVHLKGAFMVTRAALPYMREQKYGRVIVTSSSSGLYGNFGQINYSAAKMGLVGFSHTLSLEGAKYNIFSNAIVPIAYSRMSASVMAPQFEEILKPEFVAPIVAYLCHEDCQDTGGVFECAGGWTSKVRLEKTEGAIFSKPITMEEVRDKWDQVCDWSRVVHHKSSAELTASVIEKVTADEASDGGDVTVPYTFTFRDVILYALGIGAEVSQTNTSELKFLFEGHEDFSTIPSYAVLPAMNSALNGVMAKGIPGLKDFSLANALHGEQYVELKKPFPTEGTVTCVGRLVDVLDKKSGAVVLIDVETKDEMGELLSINQFSTFIVGAGGFGGKRTSQHAKPTVPAPSRPPDASLSHKTLPIQAALYRLSGDYNPLHIDGEFAKIGGFSTPILHGLCSFGIATRHIMRQYCNNDTTMVKAIKTRFVKPVLPGETIQTDMWREGSRIHFKCKSVESGKVVLDGGYIDLDPTKLTTITSTVPTSSSMEGSQELKSTAIFEELKCHVTSIPDIVKKVKAIFLWNITKAGKRAAQWTVDLKNAPGAIYRGEPQGEKAGCTLTLSDENFMGLVNGDLKAQQLFFQGKLKMSGNIMLSQKLQALFEARSKL